MSNKSALFVGSWQKVLIKVILLLLLLFVVYSLIKKIKWKPTKTETEVQDYIENVLPNQTPVDNSADNDPETISDNEAQLIANNLQIYMDEMGTNTGSSFNALECLNGASLNKVYTEFGTRSYQSWMWSDPQPRDLFGWFAAEFENAPFTSLIYYTDCVPTCNNYWDQCREMDYMRGIWSKSSIPVTF